MFRLSVTNNDLCALLHYKWCTVSFEQLNRQFCMWWPFVQTHLQTGLQGSGRGLHWRNKYAAAKLEPSSHCDPKWLRSLALYVVNFLLIIGNAWQERVVLCAHASWNERPTRREVCCVFKWCVLHRREWLSNIRAIQFCIMQVQNTVNMHTTTITNTKIIVSNVIHMYIKFPL